MTPCLRAGALAVLAVGVLALAACHAPALRQSDPNGLQMLHLGEHFDTPQGNLFVVRIQDEYRLIRCIPSGPIAGCYEDLLSVPQYDVTWNEWVDVDAVPGLRMTFLSPIDVAVRMSEVPEAAPVILSK